MTVASVNVLDHHCLQWLSKDVERWLTEFREELMELGSWTVNEQLARDTSMRLSCCLTRCGMS